MSLTPETAALLVVIGLAVGALATLIGSGGGFILKPILLLMYPHDSAKTLRAISLAAVFFNATSGTGAYARQRRIDYRSGTVFALATLPGAIGGALVISVVSRTVFDEIMGGVTDTRPIASGRRAVAAARASAPSRASSCSSTVGARATSRRFPSGSGPPRALGLDFSRAFSASAAGSSTCRYWSAHLASRRTSRQRRHTSSSQSWRARAL
jgi:hypothetical protein